MIPFVILLTAIGMWFALGYRQMPRCQEDAVVIGIGSFDAGRWSRYECGPAVDDFVDYNAQG